ncbi:MAG TPA: FecR family protein [Bryobacteraceae bacterium]|jgi:hypothetical protein|nr:FecR family protein [Bryobacteraceae bacterium]
MGDFRPNSRFCTVVCLLLAGSAVLCAQTPLADQPLANLGGAAKLMSFTGQISVVRNNSTWALNAGDIVQPQQIIVTGDDGWGVFQVADGSQFEVFPKSRVVFRANRGDWKEMLEVWLGKVKVQIEHAGGVPNHNQVRTPTAVISVRGTVFDVEVEDADGTTMVLDEEGQVEVRHALRLYDQPKVLNPNEWVRVYKNEPLAKQSIDKGSLLQRAVRAASDAFYQAALNTSRSPAHLPTATSTGGGSPADKNNGNPAPPPPPPPPPPSTP